jgi:hypothetical protein
MTKAISRRALGKAGLAAGAMLAAPSLAGAQTCQASRPR